MPKRSVTAAALFQSRHLNVRYMSLLSHVHVAYCNQHGAKGGRIGSVVTRRAIDLKIRGSSPANGSSRIAG